MNNINGKSNDLPLPEELFDYFSDDYDPETPTPKSNTKNGKDNSIDYDTISELPPLESTIINTNDSVVNNNQVVLPDIFFDNNESEESDFNESFNKDFDSTLEEVDLDDLLNETINSTNNNEDEYNRKTNNYTEDNTEVENIDIEDFFKSLETSNEKNPEEITQNQEVTGVSLPDLLSDDLLSDDYAEDESYHNEISRLDNNSTNNEIEDLDDFFKNLSEDDDDNNDLDSYELDEGILDLLREPEEEDYSQEYNDDTDAELSNILELLNNEEDYVEQEEPTFITDDLLSDELLSDDYSQEYDDDDTDAELSNILELLNNEEDYVEQEEPTSFTDETSFTDDLNPLEVEEYENNEPEYSHEETEQPQEPNKKLNKNKIKPRILLKPIISFYKFLERLGKLILEFLARLPIIGIPFKLLLNLLQKIPQVFSIVSSLFLPLLLVGLFIIINSIIYKTEQNILLPDEGSATFNNFNYDFESETASGVITNTGNIIVESTPVIRVYSYKPNFNPISWLTYSLMGECVSESTITTDIDSITELSLPCAMNSTPNKIMKVVGSIE